MQCSPPIYSKDLSCFSKKLVQALEVEHLKKDIVTGDYNYDPSIPKAPLAVIITRLRNIAFIRNEVGAHFNIDSQTGDEEVLEFGNLTIQFAELLVCPISGSLPIRNKSGSYHDTMNGSIRLHPFVEPS